MSSGTVDQPPNNIPNNASTPLDSNAAPNDTPQPYPGFESNDLSKTNTPQPPVPNRLPVLTPSMFPQGGGGIEEVVNDLQIGTLAAGPINAIPRPTSRELFKSDDENPPDDRLLKQFVTPQRMRDLWHQIDALQEEVIQNVRADRLLTDTYQQDLLYASTLLLESSANYDDSRQIVFRVRADLARERKVAKDVDRYRPFLLAYHVLWFALVILVAQADPQFRKLIPDSLPILKLAFPPILFAILGALFNGVSATIQHTSAQRDFDPIHLGWYLINPIIGGVLGMVVFIFFVVTGTSLTPNLATDPNVAATQAPLAVWLLAFIGGWQQNTAIRWLNGFLKTVTPGSRETQPAMPPETLSSPASADQAKNQQSGSRSSKG